MCHLLFLLPLIALALFFFLSPGQAVFVFLPLFLIFFSLAWVMWKGFKRPVSTGIEGLLGNGAQVVSKTNYGAKVSLKGELWDVVCGDELSVGEPVRVTGFERMTLIVRKDIDG